MKRINAERLDLFVRVWFIAFWIVALALCGATVVAMAI
jgi:hypothetical protein